MTQPSLDTTSSGDLGYGKIAEVLLRRSSLFLGVVTTVTAVSAFMAVHKKPVFESSMQLLVEPNYQGEQYFDIPQSGGNPSPPSASSAEDYATQINLMRSAAFIAKTVEALQTEYPQLTVEEVQKSFTLTRVVEGKEGINTRIFKATYTSNDPVKAQKVLSTLQNIYQSYNLKQQEMRLERGVSFINGQLQEARENLKRSQRKLEAFRKRQNLIDPKQEAVSLSTALSQVEQQQRESRTQYQDVLARWNELQKRLNLSPQTALIAARLSQSSRYQALLNEIQKTEVELAQKRVIFTNEDPRVQNLMEQRANQLGLLRAEVARVLGSTPANLGTSEAALLRGGQLGATDLGLVSTLVDAQVNLMSLSVRDQSLATSKRQLRERLNRFPALIAEYDRLQPEVESGQTLIERLLQQQQAISAQLARGGFDWQVVETPQAGRKIGPNRVQDLLLGIVVGMFLGGAVVFICEASDRVVHNSDDLKHSTLPLLGIVPQAPPPDFGNPLISFPFRKAETNALPIARILFWSPFKDSVDLIYKLLHLNRPNAPLKSLTVTSALAHEGKTTLVLGLALSAARSNQRVLVIDADLRHPSLHQHLELPNEQGLSDALMDNPSSPNILHVSLMGLNIDILTAGTEPIDPVKLLNSKQMEDLLARVTLKYDFVLIDAPPTLGIVDAVQIASLTDGTILVGRIDQVTQVELTQAVDTLSRLDLLGIVANGSKDYSTHYGSKTNWHETPLSGRVLEVIRGDDN